MMHPALKIILGIVALLTVLGFAFYIWLVIAYTPPKGPDNPIQEGIIKQGVAGENTDYAVLFGIGWRGDDKHKDYEVALGSTEDDMSGDVVLRVHGGPAPIDVTVPERRKVEIHFDGPLKDGKRSLIIPLDANYRAKGVIEIENGEQHHG